jgi:hypothetical protein
MADSLGTIRVPLYTRFGEEEYEVGTLILPVKFELRTDGVDAIVDVTVDLTEGA